MTYSQFVARLQSHGWRDAGRECLTSPVRTGTPEMDQTLLIARWCHKDLWTDDNRRSLARAAMDLLVALGATETSLLELWRKSR